MTGLSAIANHLWQSTVFAAAAWLLTLALGRNRAAVRYGVWLAASVKFLIPFSWMVALGSRFAWRAAAAGGELQLSSMMDQIGRPFAAPAQAVQAGGAPRASGEMLGLWLLGAWLCGVVPGLVFWFRRWYRMRATERAARPLDWRLAVRAKASRERIEPGVFGIFDPVLLLPEGIEDRLTPEQLHLIVAHELAHARRRDNLTAALHMVVETLFWFHPAVWWIRTRLIEERERACDEAVLSEAGDPAVYAEGILNVCKFYLASPLACAAGVTGSDLRRRIESIVAHRAARSLNGVRKALVTAAALGAIAGPIALGVMGVRSGRSQTPDQTPIPAFEAASVKVNHDGAKGGRTRSIEPGRITYLDTTLGDFIAMAYGVKQYQLAGPDWIVGPGSYDRYDIVATAGGAAPAAEIRRMLGPLLEQRFHLQFHRETKELAVYAMTLAKGGPKFHQKGDGGARSLRPTNDGVLSFQNWSMEDLGDWLSGLPSLARPVVDRTGLEGSYTFEANLFGFPKGASPYDIKMGIMNADATETVMANMPAELGLKLEGTKAPIEMLVIDHADRVPVAN